MRGRPNSRVTRGHLGPSEEFLSVNTEDFESSTPCELVAKLGVKLLTPVERPRHADFRIPVITIKFRPSGRFISAGEYRGSGLGFL